MSQREKEMSNEKIKFFLWGMKDLTLRRKTIFFYSWKECKQLYNVSSRERKWKENSLNEKNSKKC